MLQTRVTGEEKDCKQTHCKVPVYTTKVIGMTKEEKFIECVYVEWFLEGIFEVI